MTTVAVVIPDGAGSPPHLASFRLGVRVVPCAIGAAGVSDRKTEGDGATPSGLLALRRLLFRADRVRPPPSSAVPREPIGAADGWCDDPDDHAYNRPVRLPHGARAERLHREDALYDIVGVLGWNDHPVVPRRGSAIFLHCATPDLAPTGGCVALGIADLVHVLAAGLTAIEVRGG